MQVISGRRLRETREGKRGGDGWSLRQLAIRAGKPNSYTFIKRLEDEKRLTLSAAFAGDIAEALGVPLEYLFEPRLPGTSTQTAPFTRATRERTKAGRAA